MDKESAKIIAQAIQDFKMEFKEAMFTLVMWLVVFGSLYFIFFALYLSQ